MTIFSRSRMARGVKLLREHLFTPASAIATALSTKNLDRNNLEDGSGRFRVDVWLPTADLKHLWQVDAAAAGVVVPTGNYKDTRHFAVPIPMLPVQEELNTNGRLFAGDPVPVLKEVMISFDQGAEPAIFKSGSPLPDTTARNAAVKLSILAKNALWLDSDAGHDPDSELFSAELPAEAFFGSTVRFMPKVWKDLSASFSPYKTLMVAISADELGQVFSDEGDNYEMPSMLVSMVFSTTLMDHGTQLQNQPSHVGTTTADTVSVTTPASNSDIEADSADGVQTTLSTLDQKLRQLLRGGFAADGWRPRSTHITSDSVYTVIVQPMFSNFGAVGQIGAHNVTNHPYITANNPNRNIWDETYIPLNWPLEIHHVFAVINYGAPNGQSTFTGALGTAARGLKPTSATLRHDIGVGLFTGVRSDHVAWQQVARVQTLVSALGSYVIDRLRVVPNQTMTDEDFQFEVAMVPLVNVGGTAPKNVGGGAIVQGKPVYAARGTTRSSARSSINGVTSVCRGLEQFLCLRWLIEDTGADLNAAAVNHIYAGVGGNFIVICGKRPLVGDDWPVTM